MNLCKICTKETKNKTYCSEKCQYQGYRKLKVERIECECLYCQKTFKDRQNKIDNGKKYCSRVCKDNHQKELYLKEGNPIYGNVHTDEWKNEATIRVKKLWETENFRNKVAVGQEKFFEENGFWAGTDEKSRIKRIETNIERFGVACVLSLPSQQKNKEEKCLEKYGKTSIEIMREGLRKSKGTNIEQKICKLLIDYDIKFETQFDIIYDNNTKHFKTYDFYLKDFNLLIEADGDYWHGNPVKFSNLNETQLLSKKNDIIKNNLAIEMGYNLIRFWENDIKRKDFKFKLIKELKKYENKY